MGCQKKGDSILFLACGIWVNSASVAGFRGLFLLAGGKRDRILKFYLNSLDGGGGVSSTMSMTGPLSRRAFGHRHDKEQ